MISLAHIDSGRAFDFGTISDDYAKFRDVYPDVFFESIRDNGLCDTGYRVLDLGTGTGVLPRHLARFGAKFVGIDISEQQIQKARELSAGLDIEYLVSPAETLEFPEAAFDTVLACMCFTYFNKQRLLPRLAKLLKKNGRFAIMSLVWLPGESLIAKGSEETILRYNESWNGAGFTRPKFDSNGIPESYGIDLSLGFDLDKSFSYDVAIPFTRETWHGRVKASRGLANDQISEEQRSAFERDHLRFMENQPASFSVMHSATFCILKKAAAEICD
ncbi:class I SAM-dependent methyltransferase [Acidisoma sp. 7E03]